MSRTISFISLSPNHGLQSRTWHHNVSCYLLSISAERDVWECMVRLSIADWVIVRVNLHLSLTSLSSLPPYATYLGPGRDSNLEPKHSLTNYQYVSLDKGSHRNIGSRVLKCFDKWSTFKFLLTIICYFIVSKCEWRYISRKYSPQHNSRLAWDGLKDVVVFTS